MWVQLDDDANASKCCENVNKFVVVVHVRQFSVSLPACLPASLLTGLYHLSFYLNQQQYSLTQRTQPRGATPIGKKKQISHNYSSSEKSRRTTIFDEWWLGEVGLTTYVNDGVQQIMLMVRSGIAIVRVVVDGWVLGCISVASSSSRGEYTLTSLLLNSERAHKTRKRSRKQIINTKTKQHRQRRPRRRQQNSEENQTLKKTRKHVQNANRTMKTQM